MRSIAVIDNTCNTAYIMTKLLRRAGYAADFVEEPDMPYNHQPVWEDVDFALPAVDVAFDSRGDRYWRRIEQELGWVPPSWLRRPRWEPGTDVRSLLRFPIRLASAVPAALVPFATLATVRTAPIVRALTEYDFALVVGPSAPIGYLSRRPYAVITMGWEVTTLPFLTGARHPVHRARAWLQRAALGASQRILGAPAIDLASLQRLGLDHLLQPFPVPVDVDDYERIDHDARATVLGDDLAAATEGKVVYFHPSRIYFSLKGTDILLRAFAEVLRAGVPGFLILVGWGDDVERAKGLVRELDLSSHVRILPHVLSKRRLVRTFKTVDVAIVQLVPPSYSTLDREALACGTPVIGSYDPTASQPHPADDPAPILSARTVEQTRDAMIRLADPLLRKRLGDESREWIRRNHYEAPLRAIAELLGTPG